MTSLPAPDPLERVRRRLAMLRVHLACGPEAADGDIREMVRLLDEARNDLERRQEELDRAQREQERARRSYRELFDSAPDASLITDRAGRILEANHAAQHLLGTDLVETDLVDLVSPSSQRTFRARVDGLLGGRAARLQDWQLSLQGPSGERFLAEATVEPGRHSDSGEIVGLRWMIRDVTQRHRAAEALRQSEARFRAIYESAAVGIRVSDLESGGRIVQANQAFQDMTGFSEEELREQTLFDRTHPDDLEANRELVDSLVRGERDQVQVEKRIVRRDGSPFWARLTVSPVHDRSNRPVFLIGIVEDISERVRAERELRDALARTQALLDSAIDGILTIDEVGTIESINPATSRLFGYTAEELLGRNVRMLMPAPWREEHDDYLRRFRETGVRRIIGIGREVECRRKDGTLFPADLAVSEIRLGDRRIFMGTLRDITNRREAEEALRRERDFAQNLVETTHAIVLVLDVEGRILIMNRALEEATGKSREEMTGRDWFENFLPESDHAEIRRRFEEALVPGARVAGINPILVRDGSSRTIDWQSTPLLDGRGNVIGLLSIGLDVTERQRLEEQFHQSQKMEAIGRLAGGIAHDFNTLLGSCMGYTELLLQRLDAESEASRLAGHILRTTQRGAALTRQLLTFSRRQPREVRVLDAGAIVEDLRDMLQRLLGEDIRVELSVEDGVGGVEGDPSQLEQVVVNLAVNAGDAMPRGGRLAIRLENVSSEAPGSSPSDRVRLTVADTGTGMDEATRQRIFEPFFTTKEVGRGTGLGLSTVYAIVEQAGGTIEVESLPGSGTTFRIDLPAAGPVAREEEPPRAPAEIEPLRDGDGTVLVVEDDDTFRGLIEEVLSGTGYRVETAENPAAALVILERLDSAVDLILTDLVMPGMTGRELGHIVRDRWPTIRMVFMSGYSGDELERREVEASDSPFLRKPFGTTALLEAIARALASPEAPPS